MSNIISTGVVWRRKLRHLFLAQKVFLKVIVNRHCPVKSFASRCSYDSAQRFVKGIDYMMITMFEHIVCISKWRNWLLNSLHSIGFPPDITHLPQWLQGCLWKEGLHNLAPWTLYITFWLWVTWPVPSNTNSQLVEGVRKVLMTSHRAK